MKQTYFQIWAVGGLLLPALLATAAPPQPTGLAANHHSGQTFLTWTERSDLNAERYSIYRHTAPITAVNLAQAARLYTVPEDSSRFYCDRYNASGTWLVRYLERYVITDNSSPLPAGTGLLVWTLAAADLASGATGQAYYAVTTISAAGEENTSDFSAGNTIGPVAEGTADPLPIHAPNNVGERGHLYIQYMDLRHWNPTFHAPHIANLYYGLSSTSAAVTGAVQYAYPYVVYEPENNPAGPVPVSMNLHGWGGNNYEPYFSDPDPWGWPVYKIYPLDIGETWYFGFAANHDYRQGYIVETGDTIVNFTEQRLLRMLYDLTRQPPRQAVDTNRIYVYGHSMGGSGTLALALRYPNVFAAAYACEPMTDYRNFAGSGVLDWRIDVALKWGASALNLPVFLDGPAGLAAHLACYNGTGVWDWQNHQANIQQRLADEIVPFGVAHGLNDTLIPWSTQGQPFYGACNNGRRMWGGIVADAEHTWLGFNGLPPNLAMDESLVPFAGFSVVRNETVPGLKNASGNSALPPVSTGGYNQTIIWSASWTNWDGPPLDTANRWQISLRTTDGSTQTVEVTPRRTLAFHTPAGAVVQWQNLPVGQSTAIQNGQATVDADGLSVISNVLITGSGNRLGLEIISITSSNVIPLAADFDGDGLADPTLVTNGYWWVWFSGNGYQCAGPFVFQAAGGTPVAADFDGDGRADPAMVVSNTWTAWLSGNGYAAVTLEFNGTENIQPAVVPMRFAIGTMAGRRRINPDLQATAYLATPERFAEASGLQPLSADFDGDGRADPAIYQETTGNWSVSFSGNGYGRADFPGLLGATGTTALAADFDGDGLADPAIYQEAAGNWSVLFSGNGYSRADFPGLFTLSKPPSSGARRSPTDGHCTNIRAMSGLGSSGSLALAADFDGDGLGDPAIYASGSATFTARLSTAGYSQTTIILLP